MQRRLRRRLPGAFGHRRGGQHRRRGQRAGVEGDGDFDGDFETVSIAPVDGAVVSVLDLGLGVYGIDRTDGSSGELGYKPGWYSDRSDQSVVVEGVAHTLVYRQREDQTFSNDAALAAFDLDLDTGVGREVVALGFDLETDDSAATTGWSLLGVGNGIAWVRQTASSADGESERTYAAYSIESGDRTRRKPTVGLRARNLERQRHRRRGRDLVGVQPLVRVL